MRYIKIQPDIIVVQNGETAVFRFKDVLFGTWLLNNEQFGDGIEALFTHKKLKDLFDKYDVGNWVPVEDTDYIRLAKSVQVTKYIVNIGQHVIPFARAILDAAIEEPKSG